MEEEVFEGWINNSIWPGKRERVYHLFKGCLYLQMHAKDKTIKVKLTESAGYQLCQRCEKRKQVK